MLALCRQFHCLPSQLYAEDGDLFQMLQLEALANEGGDADVGQ